MSCCTACKTRSPSASPCSPSPPARPARNVFPAHVWQFIAARANASTRAALARAMPGVVSRQRYPVLNRSRKMSYKVPKGGLYKLTALDKKNPAAYKDRTWRYYIPQYGRDYYFFNTLNGPAFTISRKTGLRRPAPVFPNEPKKPRQANHTWNSYLKRVKAGINYAKGEPVRNAKITAIENKVNRYLGGNEAALTNLSIPDLMFWVTGANWMRANSSYRYRGGQWYTSSGNRLTKASILRNIKNSAPYR